MSNIALSPIAYHLENLHQGKQRNLGIITFKPGYPSAEISIFYDYCQQKELEILLRRELLLSRELTIALYPKIFSFSQDDLRFGTEWKRQTIKYLTSGPSICFLIKGKEVVKELSDYKYSLREKYGKITHPQIIMSPNEFFISVVKNLVHVIDESELQNGLWLLFEEN